MAISQALIRRLSKERFEAYRLEGESDELALARHCWNTALSEALYPCLQALEIGFRNSIHLAVSQVTSNPNWILRGDLLKGDPEREMHAAALEALRVRNKPHTAGI